MAIPSGAGTEVIKRGHLLGSSITGSATVLLVGASAVHMNTVLSVTMCNTESDTDITVDMYVEIGGSTAVYILKDQAIGAKETFIFNDRLVLEGLDELIVDFGGSSPDVDVYISYIDQEWPA